MDENCFILEHLNAIQTARAPGAAPDPGQFAHTGSNTLGRVRRQLQLRYDRRGTRILGELVSACERASVEYKHAGEPGKCAKEPERVCKLILSNIRVLLNQIERDTSLSLLCPGAKVCGKPLWRTWLGTRLATTRAFAPRYGLAVPHRHLVCLYVVQSIPP